MKKKKQQPKKKPAKIGRPKIKIASDLFEGLCRIGCTLEEISGVLNVSGDTILRWCKETYSATFAEVFRQKAGIGKMSIRRAQMKLAESGNATMLIWLGKQYLGQRDEAHTVISKDNDPERLKLLLDERIEFGIEGFKRGGVKLTRRDMLELFANTPESAGDLYPLIEAELASEAIQ